MSILVGITQRVAVDPATTERRDALDQRWWAFLTVCGLVPLPLPNHPATAMGVIAAVPVAGLILSGGNDLPQFGGDVPERDATERELVSWAERTHRPVVGICRGAQHLAHLRGGSVVPLEGHCVTRHGLRPGGRMVDSYHTYGMQALPPGSDVIAWGEDGSVEAFMLADAKITALMWHPEREAPPHADDIALFRRIFGSEA